MIDELNDYEKLDGSKLQPLATRLNTVTAADIDQAANQGVAALMRESPSSLEYSYQATYPADQVVQTSPMDNPSAITRLFRICSAGYGPFYYSHSRSDGTGGRFDLSTSGFGTCYTAANEPDGACAEVFGRVPVIAIQEIAARVLWELVPIEKVGPLLDLTEPSTADVLALGNDIFNSRTRKQTQGFADVAQSRFSGIVHQLRNLNGRRGVALFGKEGRQGGRGSWSLRPTSLISSPDFWKWYFKSTRRDPLFLSQLPLARPR